MALRVLLADESSTIKKVFQLSLQDFAVDIKTVNIGVDVAEVAASFKPDIIFADVLLQQKSGYEVSAEIKQNELLGKTPVVLMWSSFMDIDEDKFEASQADNKLEKPFEVEKLRSLVRNLVPKTANHDLSQFLNFPEMPSFDEVKAGNKPRTPLDILTATDIPATEESATGDWDMSSFDDETPISVAEDSVVTPPAQSATGEEEFAKVNLSEKMATRAKATPAEEQDKSLVTDQGDDSEWVQNNLENFKLDIEVKDDQGVDDDELSIDALIPEDAYVDAPKEVASKKPSPPLELEVDESGDDLEIEHPDPPQESAPTELSLSPEQIADIVREQCKEIIETVAWRVVPELATQIIEREIKRLIAENPENFK